MTKYLAWWLSDIRIAALVVILFFIMLALCIWSTMSISTNADSIAFYGDDSFVKQFFNTQKQYFSSSPTPCYFFFNSPNIQYQTAETQAAFQTLITDSLAQPFVEEPVSFWLNDLYRYMTSVNETLTEGNFYPKLQEFLNAPSFNYTDDEGIVQVVVPEDYQEFIVFNAAKTSILSTIFSINTVWPTDVSSMIDQTQDLRDLIPNRVFPPLPPPGEADVFGGSRGEAFVWSTYFPSTDRDAVMTQMIVQNLAYAALGVTCVLFLLCHPGLVILIGFCIVIIDVDLLGLMALWGVTLDISAFIVLAMAIGLSVDYVVHIGHCYMQQLQEKQSLLDAIDLSYAPLLKERLPPPQSPRERSYRKLKKAFEEIGTSVLNGGLTTFLGICLLALAHSPGFRTFFRILFGTVAFGLIHGLLFAPAVLTLASYACS